MRVVLHLSKFYNWVPVPPGTVVTAEDVRQGKVMPDRNGGHRMRITQQGPTTRECHISEQTLVNQIVMEKSDVRKAGRTFSRREAVAHLIMDTMLDGHAEWGWITKVEVHDDGPDEALFRATLEPLTKVKHGRRDKMVIPPAHLDDHLKVYLEPADAAAHAAHLEGHFGVVKAVSR
jgi:hypothetical protein